MSDSASQGSERRRQPRVPCTVSVLLQAGTVKGPAHLADLSPDGVCILSYLKPETGDAVCIRFETPARQKCELTGSVAWSTAEKFGVRLDQSNEAYLELVEILNSLD